MSGAAAGSACRACDVVAVLRRVPVNFSVLAKPCEHAVPFLPKRPAEYLLITGRRSQTLSRTCSVMASPIGAELPCAGQAWPMPPYCKPLQAGLHEVAARRWAYGQPRRSRFVLQAASVGGEGLCAEWRSGPCCNFWEPTVPSVLEPLPTCCKQQYGFEACAARIYDPCWGFVWERFIREGPTGGERRRDCAC